MKSPKIFSLPSDNPAPWHEDYVDRMVRWKEDRHMRQSEGIPSPEAVDEATDYYAGLYVEKLPDPVAFSRLLRRRGIPDWPNPYALSDERYHQLHADGFLWADVQYLAENLLSRSTTGSRVENEETHQNSDTCHHHAQICWLMALEETGGKWPQSLLPIHPDNLAAITLEALTNPHMSFWGIDPSKWDSKDLLS